MSLHLACIRRGMRTPHRQQIQAEPIDKRHMPRRGPPGGEAEHGYCRNRFTDMGELCICRSFCYALDFSTTLIESIQISQIDSWCTRACIAMCR